MERPPGVLRYERDELLRLQGAFGHSQGEWWAQLLKDLRPDVVEELHELLQQAVPETSQLRRRSKNSERRQRVKAKREALHALSINALGSDKDEHEECDNSLEDSLDASSTKSFEKSTELRHVGKLKGKRSRNYESFYTEDIPEPESFQPQAFAVEGEPNFESGPPEDGWEYLRRVKYEAARCPKVVVAQIDPTKLISEQTPYMPEIPEIPVCPSDLLPSKEWEEYFLGDFSLLRMALSNIRAPPTFPAERIPSLRNKAAWEVRCFGCNASVEEDESKELDSVSSKDPVAEPEGEESATPAETPSLPSIDSGKDGSDYAANESRSELLAGDKELLEPIIEFVETEIDPLLNTGSVESSYVIDFGLITDYVPNYEPEEQFNESLYFISGEPAEADDEIVVREAAAVPVPEDGPAPSAKPIESPSSNLMVANDVEHTSYGIVTRIEQPSIGGPEEQHVEDESTNSPSSHPIPYTKRDEPINSGVEVSIRVHPHTAVHAEVELFTGIGTQASENLLSATEDFEDGEESGIQSTEPSGNFEVFEGSHLDTAESMMALDGDAWALYEMDFGEFGGIDSQVESLTIGDPEVLQSGVEVKISSFSDPELLEVEEVALDEVESRGLCSGLDSQFHSLAIGDPEVVEGGVDVEIPSLSDAELLEVEDVDLPTDDFVDSLIGLEVFRSGNILESDPEEGVDPFDHSTEFKIDGPLEELLTKVFQQVGVAQLPFIHLLLRLDEVSRAALFRHHVSWLENVNGLPKDRALWLLALSAVVDTPLDSQTSAAFRALLRHCSAVRALKQSRYDEDLYLLNVLIAVAGAYFGQAEATLP